MKIKKIVSIILLVLIVINSMQGIVNAYDVNSAYVENLGKAENHLQFRNADTGVWAYVVTTIVGYRTNGALHYAYCLNVDRHGVGEEDAYTVNVTELLSDVKVWRAVINGFPYKTAGQLGVANEQDAFVATKQAIYSVIYNRDVDSFYRGGDERGTQIFNAIKAIVNQARYGSETPVTNNILNASKVGEFKADGERYYSQEYVVSSNVNVSEYTITSIENFPEGSYVANINGDPRTQFTGGEHFKVVVPKDKILNNFDGRVQLSGKAKSYPVFFGQSPNSNLQNYALTYDAYTTAYGNTTLSVDAYKSNIKVIKEDAETKYKLEGVEFNFKYSDGQNIGNYITNSNGEININNLRQGKVIATEIKTKEEYILNDKEQEILLDYASSVTTTINNEHKRGDLKVYKIDKDNNRIALGGVKFALYSYEFSKITGYYTTDANGEISINGLRTGKWALIEESCNKWYNLDSTPIDLKIEWNETTNTTIENELKKSQIKVIKVDQDNHEVKLSNVTFEVLDENKKVLETITTNAEGEAVTSRYPVRDYSKLYLKETITDEMYVLDDTIHTVELKENEIVNVTFENKKIKGQVKVIKTADDDNKITGDKKGDPISNVSFGVYDENKKYIETITTDENGTAITSLLDKGVKYIKELENGTGEWYLLNENEYSAEIVKDGDVIELNITNKPENPDIDIEKEGIIQTTANEEIKYDFTIKNTGNVPLSNFTWYDYLPTEYIRATKLITGTYNQDLNYAIYYKTNKNDYKLLRDNLNTQTNNYIDFSNIELEDDEYVTEFKAEFGKVDIGFTSVEKPQLFVKVKPDVKNDDVFTNKTKIEGYHKTYYVWDEDNHTTKVYEKKLDIKLPRTGC